MTPEIASVILSALALVLSGRAYYLSSVQAQAAVKAAKASEVSARAAAISARLPALIDLQREFRQPTITNARHYIVNLLKTEYSDASDGIRAIKDDGRRSEVLLVLHYFDNVGHLLRKGLLFPEDISPFMGKAAEDCWREAQPYILKERQRKGQLNMYGENFDFLVKNCNAASQSSAGRAA